MKRCCIFALLFFSLLCGLSNAQNIENGTAPKKINGQYNAFKKTYFFKAIDAENMKVTHLYVADNMDGAWGIAQYTRTNDEKSDERITTYGIIDTSGTILVPFIYDKLYTTKNKTNFLFKRNDTIGIVEVHKHEVFSMPGYYSNPKNKHNSTNFIRKDTLNSYCVYRLNGFFGVFSFTKSKIVVPALYDEINVYGNTAICKTDKGCCGYNCLTELSTQFYKRIEVLNQGKSFLVTSNDQHLFICNDISKPHASFNKALNKDEVLAFKNGLIIAKLNGKVGVTDQNGNEKLPYVYEDILFFGNEFFIVKRNELWAVTDGNNVLKTAFEFINVEQQNRINYTNLLYFSAIDTSAASLSKAHAYVDGDHIAVLTNEVMYYQLQIDAEKLAEELDGHELSACTKEDYKNTYVLQKKDGFHLVTLTRNDPHVVVDSLNWDAVYIIPKSYDSYHKTGVKKGKFYGYYQEGEAVKAYLKYDGVFYHSPLHNKSFNSLWSSPYVIIKKNYVYYERSVVRVAWWKWPFTPSNYSIEYQGKKRLKKYMSKTEFMEKRKIKK